MIEKVLRDRWHGISMTARFGEATERHQDMPNNWRVTLRYKGRRLTINFYGGSAVKKISCRDVVESLLLDTRAGEMDFDEFLNEFGYGGEERLRAHQIWMACVKMAKRVRKFLGEDFEEIEEYANTEEYV